MLSGIICASEEIDQSKYFVHCNERDRLTGSQLKMQLLDPKLHNDEAPQRFDC